MLSSAKKCGFEGSRSRTLTPAIARECYFATVVMEVLLEKSPWKNGKRCT